MNLFFVDTHQFLYDLSLIFLSSREKKKADILCNFFSLIYGYKDSMKIHFYHRHVQNDLSQAYQRMPLSRSNLYGTKYS